MYKKAICLVGLIFIFFVNPLFAASAAKVAIFPFKVYSEKPQKMLGAKIPSLIMEKLKLEETEVILADENIEASGWKFSDFREQGIRLGVDYILTGSVFVAGQGISIDANLVNIYKTGSISSFYSDAQGMENLFAAVSKISKEVVGEIFQKIIITDVEIAGNDRIEADAILRIIETQPGDIIKPNNITKDLRNVYKMGYFDDVVVDQQIHDNGVKVTFKVVEKPTVRQVKFRKNHVYEDDELAEFVDTRTGSILNLHKINADLKRIRLMYTEKNYHNCEITYEIVSLNNSQADILFTILEGNKIKVQKITFEGNKFFPDKKIKKAMETSEKGFFSFFTSSGDLNEDEVRNDVVRIESLYKNNGFIDTKVSDPIIDIGEEMISIHFKIEEGDQYKVKQVEITGDLIFPKEEIIEVIKSRESEYYNRDNIRTDITSIADMYADKGYANAEIKPLIQKDKESNTISINYAIDKRKPVYFSRINISGNLKTRDKVIRREIKVEEQGLYSKEDIARSFKNLNRLNYFDNIDVNPVKTQEDDKLDLNVTIVEKETGRLSFGGGYSSEDDAFFMISAEERNLFGKGQTGKIGAKISGESVYYNLSFFEPYIMDTRVSGGLELYKEEREYDYYDKDAIGFTGTLGYKLFDYTWIGVQYNIEDFDIKDVEYANTYMTPGSFFKSSLRSYIKYDSRDDLFLPTEGMKHLFSVEYAGEFLGSEIDYTKYKAEASFYVPLFWKFTGALHAEGGYLDDRSADTIDIDYERFYLGGINSIRGFDKWDIDGNRTGDPRRRGGEKYVQLNAELTFPITDKYRVACVLFYDRGDVYRTSENIDFGDQFSSFGAGVRWNSPMGPLRIEYGWVIDGKDVKKSGDGQFEFSVGASF